MPLVYLGGGIAGLSYFQATHWRIMATKELARYGIGVLDPMRGITEQQHFSPEIRQPEWQHRIYRRDRLDLKRCDAMLACLVGPVGHDHVSIGTMIEFGWADAWGKPVVAVLDNGNVHNHSFVLEIAGWIVSSIADTTPIFRDLFGDLGHTFIGDL